MGILFVMYFALFAFEGDRGMTTLGTLQSQVEDAQKQLDQISLQREGIERKVVALRPQSLDTDLLEEVARSELGYVRPDEIVILNK